MVDTRERDKLLRELNVNPDEYIQTVLELGIPYTGKEYLKKGIPIKRVLFEMHAVTALGLSIELDVRKLLGLSIEDWSLETGEVDIEEMSFGIQYTTEHEHSPIDYSPINYNEHIPINYITFERTDLFNIWYERNLSAQDVEKVKQVVKDVDLSLLLEDVDAHFDVEDDDPDYPTLELHIKEESSGNIPDIDEIYDVFKTILQKVNDIDTKVWVR